MSRTRAQVAGSAARVEPAVAEVAVEQPRIGPPSQVGTCTPLVTWPIGTSSTGAVRPQVLPHAAGDLAVAAAHAVGGAARAQRELAHAERLVLVLGPGAAEPDDLRGVDAHRAGEPARAPR